MEARLPAHLEVAAIRRLAESQGGFATVLARGDHEGGTIGIVICYRDRPLELFERRPRADGNRIFMRTMAQAPEDTGEFSEALQRMRARDPDLWLIEAEVVNPERFIAALPG